MSLDVAQLLYHVVRPALKDMGPGMASEAAERLVMYTAAQESQFRYIKQLGNGPAIGLWQMEPATFRDLRDRFIPMRPNMEMAIKAAASCGSLGKPSERELAWNLKLAAMYCRVKYLTDPRPLPDAKDLTGLAETWKRVYNTYLGAGTVEHFIRNAQKYVIPVLPI